MGDLETRIKAFLKGEGVVVAGCAGPGRLDGPPSLDPTYTMKGARSIVSWALPMNVEAIDDYLGKRSYVPHNLDQIVMNRRMNGIAERLAGFIRSLGYRAEPVPANTSYRRTIYPFALHPSFSHRFGAIAAGIGVQGWSGNVMCEEYGAANYLGTVVTDAVLESDKPRYGPRHFIDGYCRYCQMCDKVCAARMFREQDEEYVLVNGELHPRARRNDINLCNTACFGVHALSPDRKFSSWGFGWIRHFMDHRTDEMSKLSVIGRFLAWAFTKGDSKPRFQMIAAISKQRVPEHVVQGYLDKHPEKLPFPERVKAFREFGEECGVKGLVSDRLLTCGQCGVVCGPTLKETARRYSLLVRSGIAVQSHTGEMVVVPTFAEAEKLYTPRYPGMTTWGILKDLFAITWYTLRNYTGFEPKSFLGGLRYEWRRRRAVRLRLRGHKDALPAPGPVAQVPQRPPALDSSAAA